jgi:hypothetical protein
MFETILQKLWGNSQMPLTYNGWQSFYDKAANGQGTLSRDWLGNTKFTSKAPEGLSAGALEKWYADPANQGTTNLGGGLSVLQAGTGLANLGLNIYGLLESRNQYKKNLALQKEALALQKQNSERDFQSNRVAFNNDTMNKELSRHLNMGGSQGTRGGVADLVGDDGTAGGSALDQAQKNRGV